MNRLPVFILLLILVACGDTPGESAGGDFAVLAQSKPGYAQARPGIPLGFPRDHGAHPAFRIEWWYLTANLNDDEGREYGVQWTLFRTATQPESGPRYPNPWQDPQVFMAHFAITAPTGHIAFQRYARGGEHDGLSQAGVRAEPFMAWLDDWTLQSAGPDWLPLELHASQDRYAVRLTLDGSAPPVLQGMAGYSQKHPDGGGSFYYSQPFLAAKGQLEIDGHEVEVHGLAWFDREWSSQFLQPDQAGWDWFALHLDSGEKLVLFRLRAADGGAGGDYMNAALMRPGAPKTTLDPKRIELTVLRSAEVAGRALPVHWRIDLPELGRSMEVRALYDEQWLQVDFPYWEGVVTVTGNDPGSRGRGYLEMTGYPRSGGENQP